MQTPDTDDHCRAIGKQKMINTHLVQSKYRRLLKTGIITLLTLLFALGASAQSPEQKTGMVRGSILGAPEGTDFKGVQVVLLRYQLDETGKPKSQQVGMVPAGPAGEYQFDQVEILSMSVYQLGTRFQGQMLGSDTFTFPGEGNEVLMNLQIPRLSSDDSGVKLDEAIFFMEPRRGQLWITEVLHLINPTKNMIEGVQRPLEVMLPKGVSDLEMLREVQGGEHKRVGRKLLLYGNLAPGRNVVAFRYTVSAALGTLSLEKTYPYATGILTLLSPEGSLVVNGNLINPQEQKTIQNVRYDAWLAKDIEPEARLDISISGIPPRQYYLLYLLIGFVAAMIGVLFWFHRKRLADQ